MNNLECPDSTPNFILLRVEHVDGKSGMQTYKSKTGKRGEGKLYFSFLVFLFIKMSNVTKLR